MTFRLALIVILAAIFTSTAKAYYPPEPGPVVKKWVTFASQRYNVSYLKMKRRAYCESRYNLFAHNDSGASGLFQFLPSTWKTTPYRHFWIYNVKYNALAAAWMEKVGRGGEWVCQ